MNVITNPLIARDTIANALLSLSLFSLGLFFIQLFSLWRHRQTPIPETAEQPPISILKPLCGLDDALEHNLASFLSLSYPQYELVLGLHSRDDAAYPAALACRRAYPDRVRIVFQEGEPGMNPKVNQLVTLARRARHDILVVSDSNVRVEPNYLAEIAAHFADPTVGLVTHPIVGQGEISAGALMDNLHMTSAIAAGVVAVARLARHHIVVGKSMAFRRADLAALGGFVAFKDILAEDYFLGRAVVQRLGKRVAMATTPVTNFAATRSISQFFNRYRRWSVLHRQTVGTELYLGEPLLNPLPLALLATLIHPSVQVIGAALLLLSSKLLAEMTAAKILGRGRLPLQALWVVPLKDVLISLTWLDGLVSNTVDWRGNRLVVCRGTRLSRPAAAPALAQHRYNSVTLT